MKQKYFTVAPVRPMHFFFHFVVELDHEGIVVVTGRVRLSGLTSFSSRTLQVVFQAARLCKGQRQPCRSRIPSHTKSSVIDWRGERDRPGKD